MQSRSIRASRQTLRAIYIALFTLFVSACTSPLTLDELAEQRTSELLVLRVDDQPLYALRNDHLGEDQRLVIYLGGDGRPWQGDVPAKNPTGQGLMAAELALLDARPAYYLSRPCYHWESMPESCEPAMWTSDRYSGTIADTLADGIGQLLHNEDAHAVELVGYSGGGALAMLIAERLTSVHRVVTVAANLDTDAWTHFHDVLPLEGSENPTTGISSPTRYEQIHLLGTQDSVVPPQTLSRYRERHPDALYLEVEGFNHQCCWREFWKDILIYIDRDIPTIRASRPLLPDASEGLQVPGGSQGTRLSRRP